jgi:hypothetical protein
MSQKVKTIKKELTLIESVVENSKEVIKLNNVIHLLRQVRYAKSKCKYKPIDPSIVKQLEREYRSRVTEIRIHTANMLKAAYTKDFKMNFDEFSLSTAQMQAGHVNLFKGEKNEEKVHMVLFLADVKPDLLEPIYEGEIREYTKDLDELYLSKCPPVWKPDSTNDIYLEQIKLFIK